MIEKKRLRADNTSGYAGVSWDKANKRWHARIQVAGKQVHVGIYLTAIEASEACDRARSRSRTGAHNG